MGTDIQFQAVKCNVCILVGGNKFGMGDIVGIVWGAVEIKLCAGSCKVGVESWRRADGRFAVIADG